MNWNADTIRQQFPLLTTKVGEHPVCYLDTAATTPLCRATAKALQKWEETNRANVHRGVHGLTERSTNQFEAAREQVQTFLHAEHTDEIVWTSGCTASLNLVAHTWAEQNLNAGESVLLTRLEHHSNVVPWLQLKERKNVNIVWSELIEDGAFSWEIYEKTLRDTQPKLVAITGLSNVTGEILPLQKMISLAHEHGARVVVDAAQLAPHKPINVQELDCDFLAFSGHKVYGPTGVGVLYGKRELLAAMPPFFGGGGMIASVEDDSFVPADPPQRCEAGTPPIGQAIGLGAALEWLSTLPWEDRLTHEQKLYTVALNALQRIEGLQLVGPTSPETCSSCLSFTLEGVHPHDLTDLLGQEGICLRAGHHCAQPLHRALGLMATTRLSFGIFTTEEEITEAAKAIERLAQTLRT